MMCRRSRRGGTDSHYLNCKAGERIYFEHALGLFYNLDELQRRNKEHRSAQWYMDRMEPLLNSGLPVVMLTDSRTRAQMPEWPRGRVKYVEVPFEKLVACQHRATIHKNREAAKAIYSQENRNTAGFLMATMSKSEAMIRAAEWNPFRSTAFCWMDVAFVREHPYVDFTAHAYQENLRKLARQEVEKDGRYRMGLIDWVPAKGYGNYARFFAQGGPCTVSGQMHGGPRARVLQVHKEAQRIFAEQVEKGFGHADEQVMFYTYLRHPEWFDLFPTDYFCDPFNAIAPRRHVHTTCAQLIPHLLQDGQKRLARHIAQQVLREHAKSPLITTAHEELCQRALGTETLRGIAGAPLFFCWDGNTHEASLSGCA